jgi:hypothetical protein
LLIPGKISHDRVGRESAPEVGSSRNFTKARIAGNEGRAN